MAGIMSSMYWYNYTLQQSSAISNAIVGNFSGLPKNNQEILTAKGEGLIELSKVDASTGKLITLLSWPIFGIARSMAPFRLTGGIKDFIIIGSDSGRIVILEYLPEKNTFKKVHQETFGKTGCRRIVPGEYVAADPKGRAVMLAAIEKQKVVYVLNRDASANLTISSPLEAHKSHAITFCCIAVDVGFENPIFGCIEMDYSDVDADWTGEAAKAVKRHLTYYELDLGLNHVVRKWSEPIADDANMLIAVPGGSDGPSGVVICSENKITWKHQGHAEVSCDLPVRKHPLERKDRKNLVIAHAVLKFKDNIFFLIQTEQGDLLKVTLEYPATKTHVTGIHVKYFDSIPPAIRLSLLRSGYLFASSEFGNHHVYVIKSLGDEVTTTQKYFETRPLTNINLTDEVISYGPILDAKVVHFGDSEVPSIYTLCGQGARSTLRLLRHGLEVSQIASSKLPGVPDGIWTVKATADDIFDKYIIVSFTNATLVLSIGETVQEVNDSGINGQTSTISVSQIGADYLLQVYPYGLRLISVSGKVSEWKPPQDKVIRCSSCNSRQVVIALSGGELVYFELEGSRLNEYEEKKYFTAEIVCADIPPLTAERVRTRFLAIGCADNTVKILSLDSSDCLSVLGTQAVTAVPESLCFAQMNDREMNNTFGTLFLNIGLQNGIMQRVTVDTFSGALSDTRNRFLGARPVRLYRVKAKDSTAVMALSSKPWLGYIHQGRYHLDPLSYEMLEYVAVLNSEQCPNGMVAICEDSLRVIAIEKLGTTFNQITLPLKYSPRKCMINPLRHDIIIIESDHNTFSLQEQQQRLIAADPENAKLDSMELEKQIETYARQYGLPKAGYGKWASCVRIVDPRKMQTSSIIEFENDEAAFSMTICNFVSHPSDLFLVVGTAKGVKFNPKTCVCGYIYVYRFGADGSSLEPVHKTEISDIPGSMVCFQGRLLVGVGKVIRFYEMGKKCMLKKWEDKITFNSPIHSIQTLGDRIIIGDTAESYHYGLYSHSDREIHIFADDPIPRFISCGIFIDYDTIAAADKFGNFFVNRLSEFVMKELEEDPQGNRVIHEKSFLQGSAFRMDNMLQYYVGPTITSLNKIVLVPGGREVLIYTTIMGGLGLFVPMISKEDVDFLQMTEMYMRSEFPPLCGREHVGYRSFYKPVRNIVDGDLCEQFHNLTPEKKNSIATSIDIPIQEISKKLDSMRTRVAF